MKPLILFIAFVLAAIPASLAQTVTSFSPADGTENVPLSTTVSITFDTPIPAGVEPEDIGPIMEPLTIISPEEEFMVSDVAISSDRLTITLTVDLAENTAYNFAFFGMPGDGVPQPLNQVFTTSFHTGTYPGNLSISGTLSYEYVDFFDDDWDDDWDDNTLDKRLSSGTSGAHLRGTATAISNFLSSNTRNVTSGSLSDQQSQQSLASGNSLQTMSKAITRNKRDAFSIMDADDLPEEEELRRKTIVVISDGPLDFFGFDDDDDWDEWDEEDEEFPQIFAITTVDELTGGYTASRLGDGVYYVTAIFISAEFLGGDEGEFAGLLGYGEYYGEDEEAYDPVPVTLSGSSVTGIDFTVFVFDLDFLGDFEYTAFEAYDDVADLVYPDYPDAGLYVIEGTYFWDELSESTSYLPNGESLAWTFSFLEVGDTANTDILGVHLLGTATVIAIQSSRSYPHPPIPSPADTTMLDSDQAMLVALDNGARDLIDDNRGSSGEWEVSYRLSRDTEFASDFEVSVTTDNPFWFIELSYYPDGVDGSDFEASVTGYYAVDAFTGAFLQERIVTSVDPDGSQHMPQTLHLSQNYPNPFNPTTSISFTLPSHAEVRLSVYDITGRQVTVLVNGLMTAGTHTVGFDAASHLASGVYLYRLQSNGETLTNKMTLIK